MKNSPSHSYSSLNTHEICPEQYRLIYLLKDFKKSYTPESGAGVDIHRAAEMRLRYQQPLPASLAKLEPYVASIERAGKPECEVSLGVTRDLKPSGFSKGYLRGKFDVIVRWPEQRRAFIGDWKSGKIRESSDQLEIGALLLMANDETIDWVTGANIWLQKPGPGTPYKFLRRDLSTTWLKWLKRMETVEKDDPAKEWEKRESALCGWCPVQSCTYYRGG